MKTIVLAYHELGAAGLKAAIRNGLDVVARARAPPLHS